MRRTIRAVAATVTLLLAACAAPTGEQVRSDLPVLALTVGDTRAPDAAAASEALAWQVIRNSEGANRLTSPSSLAMSLAMVAEGARGASLASIDAALGVAGEERGRAFGALRQSLLGYEDLPGSVSVDEPPSTPVVHLAGQVVAIDRPVNGDFLDRLATYYDTGATQVARADAKAVLDAWVERNTAGLIERSAVEVRPDTLAVLQDALLFAAAWRDAFEEASVEFAASSGAERVDAVADTVTARYAEGDGWVAVRLAYDDALAADVILPAADPESLSSGDLAAVRLALDAAAEERVAVTMPAFDLKGKTDLLAALPEIDLSDLGGIADGATGDQWVQQVRLQVGARGTVGAAVTEVAVGAGAPAPEEAREFIVDRPYVLRVLDTRTGWPLFLTLIGDPAA